MDVFLYDLLNRPGNYVHNSFAMIVDGEIEQSARLDLLEAE